jgi:hypothetical protein
MTRELAIDHLAGTPIKNHRGDYAYSWQIRALRRWPLKTPYNEVIKRLVINATRPDVNPPPRVVVDMSGVGTAIFEQVSSALSSYEEIETIGIAITGGTTWKRTGRETFNVAKTEITSALAEAMGCERVIICPRADGSKMENQDVLERELAAFKIRVSKTGYTSVEAMGSDHDDCVISIALPLWLGTQRWCHMRTRGTIGASDVILRPYEQTAIDAEQRALERAELEALELERQGRNLHKEREAARQKRRDREAEQNMDHDLFWDGLFGDRPRRRESVYLIVAAPNADILDAQFEGCGVACDLFRNATGKPVSRRGGWLVESYGQPEFATRLIKSRGLGEVLEVLNSLDDV